MLKIQRLTNGQTVFALSGRMKDECIIELGKLLEAEPVGKPIVLYLQDLTLAGQNDIEFLARWEERGVTLRNCASYIREWVTRHRQKK